MVPDPLVFVLLLLVGCVAFLFGVIYLICRVIGGLGRGIFRLVTPRRSKTRVGRASFARACPREDCRNIEYRDARYCSRCGSRLTLENGA